MQNFPHLQEKLQKLQTIYNFSEFLVLSKFFSIYFSFCILIQYKYIKIHGNVLYHGHSWQKYFENHGTHEFHVIHEIYEIQKIQFMPHDVKLFLKLYIFQKKFALQSKNRVSRETGGWAVLFWVLLKGW